MDKDVKVTFPPDRDPADKFLWLWTGEKKGLVPVKRSVQEVLDILEQIARTAPLEIVSEDVEGEALATLTRIAQMFC